MSIFGNNIIGNESGNVANIENYKIVIIGDQHVGKTSILSRYKYESFEDGYAPTVGIDFLTKNEYIEDKTIRLIMWDTAGQERFKSLIPSYLKNAHCIILAFDLTSKSSFNSLEHWLREVRDNVQEGTLLVVCGNKLDLASKRTVSRASAEKFCKDNSIKYCETSAVTGEGITELFNTIKCSFCDLPSQNYESPAVGGEVAQVEADSGPRINIGQGSFIVENNGDGVGLNKRRGGCCGKGK